MHSQFCEEKFKFKDINNKKKNMQINKTVKYKLRIQRKKKSALRDVIMQLRFFTSETKLYSVRATKL